MITIDDITKEAIDLLVHLIQTESLSKAEENAAIIIRNFLKQKGITYKTHLNNTWCFNQHFDNDKPTILFNSHIDTVKPAAGWIENPFGGILTDGKLIGLGSNDAGGALVSLMATFIYFNQQEDLPYNICFAATAEEEISGKNGIAAINHITQQCSFAIIGEPTTLEMATAERGLMVLDGLVKGKTGHAARDEGINALYLAVEDIQKIKAHKFVKEDDYLGPIKTTVTMIEAGYQHNVVPDLCKYVVDVRTVDTYTYEEIIDTLNNQLHGTLTPRSTRLKPSSIPKDHIIVRAANTLGIPTFGSSTLSDQALLTIPSVKLGPGKSARSHTPDEFILISEIENGIKTYISLLKEIFK